MLSYTPAVLMTGPSCTRGKENAGAVSPLT